MFAFKKMGNIIPQVRILVKCAVLTYVSTCTDFGFRTI